MLKTPCYIINTHKIIQNCEILESVKKDTGCKILLAQKAYSCYQTYPLIANYLDGTTASGINEAKLGFENFGKETHIFAPAYSDDDFEIISKICDHISFNSLSQWEKYRKKITTQKVSLRVNPLYSEIETEIYNPCAKFSRLGITPDKLENYDLSGISGLHFHTLCEQGADTLERTIPYIEKYFGEFLKKVEFLNMGGGHHITKENYDLEKLISIIKYIQNKYNITVYLEPGEAVVLNAGYLVASVVDIVENGINTAILDASAACHAPDVLEMPYRPSVRNSGGANEMKFTYRLAGNTCLAGDIFGDYSFASPLKIDDKVIFEDMGLYTFVKNNTFNGINLPDIVLAEHSDFENIHDIFEVIKTFGYEDFKSRL
jgi:carboxynorspermidine decarboxylase